jgi:hypothetical protein
VRIFVRHSISTASRLPTGSDDRKRPRLLLKPVRCRPLPFPPPRAGEDQGWGRADEVIPGYALQGFGHADGKRKTTKIALFATKRPHRSARIVFVSTAYEANSLLCGTMEFFRRSTN